MFAEIDHIMRKMRYDMQHYKFVKKINDGSTVDDVGDADDIDEDEDLNSPAIRKYLINEYSKNRKRIFQINQEKSVENKINIKRYKR